jgi:hypothetical protein
MKHGGVITSHPHLLSQPINGPEVIKLCFACWNFLTSRIFLLPSLSGLAIKSSQSLSIILEEFSAASSQNGGN